MVELADVTAESFSHPFPEAGTAARARPMLKVALATMIGGAIEAFDFLAYGTAAALVFNKLFFPTFNPTVAQLAAFGAFAAGFFARPVGGLIFGHYGDRLGRKKMLMIGLVLMGLAVALQAGREKLIATMSATLMALREAPTAGSSAASR